MGFLDPIVLGDCTGYRLVGKEEGEDMQVVLRALPVNPYRNPAIAVGAIAGRRAENGFRERLEEAKLQLLAVIDQTESRLSRAIAR